ncbi:unnamed protein product [Psylliodes chrysocephalus]|uniref:Uncharacterized protein n=1 Tax=Psylliodes chrysocephalus TaxID=3402493 RepID=A0A9P0CMI2_9CUCU|nr:unnamed protein product [Psylliodes chrysocephala]
MRRKTFLTFKLDRFIRSLSSVEKSQFFATFVKTARNSLLDACDVKIAPTHQTVAIVGEDVDVLVIMMGLNTSPNVYLLKPGKGKAPQLLYQPQSAMKQNLAKHMMFPHAMSRCDSTKARLNS